MTQGRLEYEDSLILRKAKIEDGPASFQCHRCFEVIPEGRRRAYPGVKTCVRCQEEIEGGK